jgi:hypothetical protein
VSIEAMVWAKRTQTGSPTRRIVLYVLADYADEAGTCWPSQRTIADQTELNERTVRRALGELEEVGLIRRIQRARPNGSRTTDRIELALERPPDREPAPAPDRGTGGPRTEEPGAPDTAPGPEPTSEPSVEPTETPGPASPEPGATLFEIPTLVDELCAELADAIGNHRGGIRRPPVTKRWREDMRLLLERGPLHQDEPERVPPDRVRACIAVVFGELAEPQGASRFCWADQIRSAGALRDHWWQLYRAAQNLHQRSRHGKLGPVMRAVHGGEAPDIGKVLADHSQAMAERGLRSAAGGYAPAIGTGS